MRLDHLHHRNECADVRLEMDGSTSKHTKVTFFIILPYHLIAVEKNKFGRLTI